ncbi:MAG TPA: M48 family metalloprotease, partial [Fimbriimonadaceae bacterium]|nr:M48 family metalloprotease [Fimbriimonadaceae bacterium]
MLTSVLLGALILQGQTATPVQKPGQTPPPAQTQLSKEEIQHQKDLENDIAVGKKACVEIEKVEKLSDNKEYQDRVSRIGQQLAAIARTTPVEVYWGDKRLNKFDYTFKVLKGDDVNAFTLPGGFVYVYEGLIKYVQSDDELAAVLAHEICHAEQRHYAQLVKEQSKITAPGLIAILA